MIDEAALARVDEELDAFGVSDARLDAVRRALPPRPSLAEADEAIRALADARPLVVTSHAPVVSAPERPRTATPGFDTLVPEGSIAHPATWDEVRRASVAPPDAPITDESSPSAELELPAVLSDPPPADAVGPEDRAPKASEASDGATLQASEALDSVELVVDAGDSVEVSLEESDSTEVARASEPPPAEAIASEPPPASEAATGTSAGDDAPFDPDDRPSVELFIEPHASLSELPPSMFPAAPDLELAGALESVGEEGQAAEGEERADASALDLFDDVSTSAATPLDDGSLATDLFGVPSNAPEGSAPLELDLEPLAGEPTRVPSSAELAELSGLEPSLLPPPPRASDPTPRPSLDDELEELLRDDDVSDGGPEPEAELQAEPTALFSAEMFGVTREPSLADLAIPPEALADAEPDSVELDLDDDLLVVEADELDASDGTPTGTQPPPPPPSTPSTPPKPGFLGRLLQRK